MKNLLLLTLLFTTTFCKADYWTRKADFPLGNRHFPYYFSIGNKAYIGGGFDSLYHSLNDLWEYNPALNVWAQMANLPMTIYDGTTGSVTVGNKGYVIIVDTFSKGKLWEYNPPSNLWTAKADFPAQVGVYFTANFVINGIAYFWTGSNCITGIGTDSLYAYNPITNSWSTLTSNLQGTYTEGTAFAIGNKAYMTGFWQTSFPNRGPIDSLWIYDPAFNSLAIGTSFPDSARTDAASFAINGMGYFGVGDKGGADTNLNALCNDWWQFNPNTNFWTQKASLPSSKRDETAYFVIGNKGYVCFGGENPNAELWEYTPDSLGNTTFIVEELSTPPIQTKISPNPFSTFTTISFGKELHNAELILTDITGREIESYKNINGTDFLLQRSNLVSGIYFYCIKENGLIVAKDKIVVQ